MAGTFRCIPMKPGSLGKASPGFEIDVIDDNGQTVELHKEGNFAVKTYPGQVGLFTRYVVSG